MASAALPHLRAFLIGVPLEDGSLDSYRVVELVANRLREMFGARARTQTLFTPEECTRDNVRGELKRWVDGARAHADAAHLLYFFGHGRRLMFLDPDLSELAGYALHGLICARERDNSVRAVLDFELSAQLTRLHGICGNVAVIVDSCQSATVFKSPTQTVARAWPWVKEALAGGTEVVLAADSHPDIVRLAGCSPVQRSYAQDARVRGEPMMNIGRFTRALLEVLDRVIMTPEQDWKRMSWTLLAHAVRQQVIDWAGTESQWVALAGPGDRPLFLGHEHERGVGPARVVGCLVFPDSGTYWIRAGRFTCVSEGDRWALVEPCLDAKGALVLREPHMKVELVQSNRARLDLRFAQGKRPPLTPAAKLVRVAEPTPVFVAPDVGPALELEQTVWLTRGSENALHHVTRTEGGQLELSERLKCWTSLHFATDEGAALIEVLEDRVRSERILGLGDNAEISPLPSPIRWEVGVDRTREAGDPVLAGDALWVRLVNGSFTPEGATWSDLVTWFASIVLIDPLGRPSLLNASEPDGIELEPGGVRLIGRRFGAARKGLVLRWPEELPASISCAQIRLVCLSSRRPVQLGHLAQAEVGADPATFALQAIPPPESDDVPRNTKAAGTKSSPAKLRAPVKTLAPSEGWGWQSLKLEIERG